MRYALIVGVVAGCGPVLEPGSYDTVQTVSYDSCGGAENQTAVWTVDESGEGWSVTNEANRFTASGNEGDDGRITLQADQSFTLDGCPVLAAFEITLRPSESAVSFTGDIDVLATATCDDSRCSTNWSLTGTKR